MEKESFFIVLCWILILSQAYEPTMRKRTNIIDPVSKPIECSREPKKSRELPEVFYFDLEGSMTNAPSAMSFEFAPSASPTKTPKPSRSRHPSSSPSKSPRPTLSSKPSRSPNKPPDPDTCVDDPNFYHKTADMTCLKIGSRNKRREKRCKDTKVQGACPRTCGLCCEDNPKFRFLNRSQNRNCRWLSDGPPSRPEKYCDENDNDGRKIKENCVKTCDYCNDPVDLSPTASPSEYFKECKDDGTFFHKNAQNTCSWIRQRKLRREEYCIIEPVRENCPLGCGLCCENDRNFLFETFKQTVNCKWVGDRNHRQNKYCNTVQSGQKVSDACPVACDSCYDPIASVVPTPEISLTPTVYCANDPSFSYVFPERTCKWIRNKESRRREFCEEPVVLAKCPQACGLCCNDDPSYKFGNNKDCAWIRKNPSGPDQYCNIRANKRMVRDACPVACNECMDDLFSPTVSPAPSKAKCINDPDYFYDEANQTCQWIRFKESRRQEYCKKNQVKDKCPQTCGLCCQDENDYTFKNKKNLIVSCYWVGKKAEREKKYCDKFKDGRMVQDACPLACGQCLDPVE